MGSCSNKKSISCRPEGAKIRNMLTKVVIHNSFYRSSYQRSMCHVCCVCGATISSLDFTDLFLVSGLFDELSVALWQQATKTEIKYSYSELGTSMSISI